MQNNNLLSDTNTEYDDMQSCAAHLPEKPAPFLRVKQDEDRSTYEFCLRVNMCICCELLNNSADITRPQVFGFFFREGRELKRIRILNAS